MMKLLILSLLFFSLLCFSSPAISVQHNYEGSAFVGLVTVHELEGEFVIVKPVQVWKNSFADTFVFRDNDAFPFQEGEDYLLFAYQCDKSSILCLHKDSPPIIKEEVSLETYLFLDAQPCINVRETFAELKKRNPNATGACNRMMGIAFCGCNGKQYTSECEAHHDGVMKYKVRACE